jgi:hypothetical protein
MNVFNEHPFKVLFDYGHNAHAVAAMADLAQRLDVTGRRIVVLAGPGDRRDEDLRAIADAVAGRFDHYICRRDDSLRERGPDEVPKLQAAQLQSRGVPAAAISIIPDEQEAIDAALQMGQPGDLLLVFADALIRSWKQVTKFKSATSSAPGTSSVREGAHNVGESSAGPASGIGGFMASGASPLIASPTPAADTARGAVDGVRKSSPQTSPGKPGKPAPVAAHSDERPGAHEAGELTEQLMPGVIRDERGVWIAPETED